MFRLLSESNESIDLAEIVGGLLEHYLYRGHVAVGRLVGAVKVQDEVELVITSNNCRFGNAWTKIDSKKSSKMRKDAISADDQ